MVVALKNPRRHVLPALDAAAASAPVNTPRATAASTARKPRIDVALGSGGLHGYTYVSVLRAFEALGYCPVSSPAPAWERSRAYRGQPT